MRWLRCKLCGEKWGPRRGTTRSWYEEHLRRHNLTEPVRLPGESLDDWLGRLTEFQKQYFEG